MIPGAVTSHIDVASLVLYAFFAFFAGLVLYLRREDRREGYPLESDTTGKLEPAGVGWIPAPKVFRLRHGETLEAPNNKREGRTFAARRTAPWPGAPIEPTGNPLIDGIGPAAWAERSDSPERTMLDEVMIVPLRSVSGIDICGSDPDPRGMAVVDADRAVAGTVTDIWVDRAELLIRYLEVSLDPTLGGRTVILPINFTVIDGRRREVKVIALLAHQFADVPALKSPDQITLREEDQICGYYGGGHLYATPLRTESQL